MLRNVVKRTLKAQTKPQYLSYSKQHGSFERTAEDEYIAKKEYEQKLKRLEEHGQQHQEQHHEMKQKVEKHVEQSNSKIDALSAQIEALQKEIEKLKK